MSMQTAATDAKVAHLEPLANALQEDNERLLKARRGPFALARNGAIAANGLPLRGCPFGIGACIARALGCVVSMRHHAGAEKARR